MSASALYCVLCGDRLTHDLEYDTGVCDDCDRASEVQA